MNRVAVSRSRSRSHSAMRSATDEPNRAWGGVVSCKMLNQDLEIASRGRRTMDSRRHHEQC